MGQADGIEPTKLLPPKGQYSVTIAGKQAQMEITELRVLRISDWKAEGVDGDKVIIEVNNANII